MFSDQKTWVVIPALFNETEVARVRDMSLEKLGADGEASGISTVGTGAEYIERVDRKVRSSYETALMWNAYNDNPVPVRTMKMVAHRINGVLSDPAMAALRPDGSPWLDNLLEGPPIALLYRRGHRFKRHSDGDETSDKQIRRRALSISCIIEHPEKGGRLRLFPALPAAAQRAIARPGSAIVFNSRTEHVVTPVLEGQRLSLVTWLQDEGNAIARVENRRLRNRLRQSRTLMARNRLLVFEGQELR